MVLLTRYIVLFLVVAITGVESQGGFVTPLSVLMSTRNNMVRKMRPIASNVDNPDALKNFVQILKDLMQHVKTFGEAPVTNSESRSNIEMLKSIIRQDRAFTDEEALYKSYSLKKDKRERLGMLWNRMVIDVDQFLSSGKDTHVVGLSKVCQGLPLSSLNSMKKDMTKEITILDVCTGLSSCATVSRPYHWTNFDSSSTGKRRGLPWFGPGPPPSGGGRSENLAGLRLPYFTDAPTTKPTPDPRFEQDIRPACTPTKQCNVAKALPMMTGILWYKIGEMILQRLCSQSCTGQSNNYDELYQNVLIETDLLISYATTLPNNWQSIWNPFFNDGVALNGYVKLDVALSLVKEKKDFESVGKLCHSFKFKKACPISDLYTQYTLIKKIQQKRTETPSIKDLRLLAHVDHARMLMLQTDEARQLELLGSIKKLDDNLQASVAGISEYFKGVAEYDQGIASADITFIQQELTKYETSLQTVEKALTNDLKEAMDKMEIVLGANLAEKTAALVVVLAANSNPLKLVFAGPDLKDTMDASAEVANAASQLKRGLALIDALDDLTQDSLKLQTAFNGNKIQISSLDKVVKKIRNGNAQNIGEDADLFIKEYGAYTPQTDRSQLNHNSALWESFKGATCDLLNGDVGVGGSYTQSQAGAKLLCEKMDGTLAQFITLREDIFDFQFQLVDAIASVVRGNIAQRLAQNIEGKHDSLHATTLMTGFFMIQNKLQTVCSVYCDRLEYEQLGNPIPACATSDGLFRKKNIQSLIDYKNNQVFDIIDRDVHIPTQSAYKKYPNSIVDLRALARGEKVVFKIPSDLTWLHDHRWMIPGEDTIPFVLSFKLFLPQREYKTGANLTYTSTRVTITAVAGSAVSPNTGVVYLLPRDQSTYRSVYEEGYRSCSPTSELPNPYSLCNNLPKICDKLQRSPGTSLLPTVVTTWDIQSGMYQGSVKVAWDAPSSATNLLLKAQVKIKVPVPSTKRFLVPSMGLSDAILSEDGCCRTDNRYIKSWSERKCFPCPSNTTSNLGGYYCQIDM